MTNPWTLPEVARQQRALVDAQLQESTPPMHFQTFAAAVAATECPGHILEVGCASGYGREILDRAGVKYASYTGSDISEAALNIAHERYPESRWLVRGDQQWARSFDTVIDGCAVMHVEEWRKHIADLCAQSRRWLVMHRLPVNFSETVRTSTRAYGQEFPAWSFAVEDVEREVRASGFVPFGTSKADGDSVTLVFCRPRHFATYFDGAYATRATVMARSLRRWCPGAVVHALCWDGKAAEVAQREGMRVERIEDHGEWLENLPGPARTRVEQMWTAGPAWIAHVMEKTGEPAIYVDADVMFHANPEQLFAEWSAAGVGLVRHGFARAEQGLPGPTVESHSAFGVFNVGVVHFGERSHAEWWARMCRDWCYDRIEGNAYGDQKYLEGFAHFLGQKRTDAAPAAVTDHPGACLGPWAVHTRALDVRGGVIHFGNRPMVAYHYSGYRELPEGHTVMTRPEYQLTARQEEILYRPYMAALDAAKESR